MTPTEVLKEIRKMPISARRRLRDELDEMNGDAPPIELKDCSEKEKRFIESMMRKGLITHVPNRFKGSISRNTFKRVNVIGKPISQTIIEDRG